MSLGAQWYILFNVIAGASAIPNDLREVATNLRLPRLLRWRRLILPAIFPAYVTGGITAAGGAWNASIVAEVVTYGQHHPDRHRAGRLHRAGHRRPGTSPQILVGVAGHERLRRRAQPAVLATALPPRRDPLLPAPGTRRCRR